MSETRRQYTEEFKHEAVRLLTNHGYGVTEAARNLGINAKMLGRCKRQASETSHGAFAGNGHRTAATEELVRLRNEDKRLRMERESLKKTAGFCASASSEDTP